MRPDADDRASLQGDLVVAGGELSEARPRTDSERDRLRNALRGLFVLGTSSVLGLGLLAGQAGDYLWWVLGLVAIQTVGVITIGRLSRRRGSTPMMVAMSSFLNLGLTCVLVVLGGGLDSEFWVLFCFGPLASSLSGGKYTKQLIVISTAVAFIVMLAPHGAVLQIPHLLIAAMRCALMAVIGLMTDAAIGALGVIQEERVTATTKLARVESELSRREAMLVRASKMESLGLFAGGVAHDFNNMLTVMQGSAELVRLEIGNDDVDLEEIETLLQQQADAMQQATELTRQILLFSRGMATDATPLDLSASIEKILPMLSVAIGETIKLRWEPPDEALSVLANHEQLSRALLNLLVNARDAMPDGGTVTLRARATGTEATLEVHDSGHGMSEATKLRAIEPFFSTKPRGEGTGMGLSIVYGIVQGWGGTMAIESHTDEGTTVYLTLRTSAAHGTVAEDEDVSTHSDLGRLDVLLVDDDLRVGRVGRRLLTALGHEASYVSSVEAALEMIEDSAVTIDLLVTDMTMPGGGGSAVLEALWQQRPTTPWVCITGHADRDDVFKRVAPERVLLKPFGIAALEDSIRAAVEKVG